MTALGRRDEYGQGELKGRPLSLACQIQNLANHEEMTDILESIGLKFGNGKSEKEWISGDKVKVLIKNNTQIKTNNVTEIKKNK